MDLYTILPIQLGHKMKLFSYEQYNGYLCTLYIRDYEHIRVYLIRHQIIHEQGWQSGHRSGAIHDGWYLNSRFIRFKQN